MPRGLRVFGHLPRLAAILAITVSAALAEVKEGDPGATCTSSTETIQGQSASCKSCKATKCDTSGTTVSNCRVETTKTCTIAGKVVSPTGRKGGAVLRDSTGGKLKMSTD